ncbi:MAG: hypothetical protein FWE20_03995 [Defluviitaleaceae bacterium]|nr:hypothetical protein [Defluviitaleaceae bacterium]
MIVKRILALILVLSLLPAAVVYANVQITHITDATVTQIVSTSAIRVQLSGGQTALVRIHGVSPIISVPNNNEHARAFLHNNVMGRQVRLSPPGGVPQMDGRFNVMTVILDGVNIAERINGDTLPNIVDVLPPRPTFADLRFAGQLFVNRDGHFIPHYRGDGFDAEPLWFFYDDDFFRFNPFNTGRTLLYFRSNNHFYPFFPGVNTNFTGNLFYIDPDTGQRGSFIPGVTPYIGRVYFWSQGSYHLYVPWFWGYTHFPWYNWGGDSNPWQWSGANHPWQWSGNANNWNQWGFGEHNNPWFHWGGSNNPWHHWGGSSNPWQWGSPNNPPHFVDTNDLQWHWNVANSPWWNWSGNWGSDGSMHWGWGGTWGWDGSWRLDGIQQPWTFDGRNPAGAGQWIGPPTQDWVWNENTETWTLVEHDPNWIWGETEHGWQWWSANNPWYWAGTNNPWQWGGDQGHPFQWYSNNPGSWGAQNPLLWSTDGTGPWDTVNNPLQHAPVNAPWFSNAGSSNPWQMGFVNYPDIGFIWKPQLYFQDDEGHYVPFFPGITRHIGEVFILQGTEFVPYRPRFDGPREWEYFHFENNALELFHNFRDSQWDRHVGQLYYFDHTAGRFLPYLGSPIR